jgi:pilus assembly protein Flp/PilA
MRANQICQAVRRFLREDEGPTAVEYAVLLALILVATITSIMAVGNSSNGVWKQDTDSIINACEAASGG